MPDAEDFPEREEQLEPSKTALKRRMTALQELGEALTRLSDKQLSAIPIDDERLLTAVREVRGIRSNSARRRHLQYIGKLMRDIDAEPIEHALQALDHRHRKDTDAFHELEQLRDSMLAAGVGGISLATERWPQADRQQLRQLLLQHQRETQRGKAPAASRKLFRYLRELRQLYG
jgi:ribosome-associated protein